MFFVQFADAFTNKPIKWLHKISNNCVSARFLIQPIRNAISVPVSSSLCVRKRLLFKPMKTAFAERVSDSLKLSPSCIRYAV